jgi:hypothetical protein
MLRMGLAHGPGLELMHGIARWIEIVMRVIWASSST